MKKNKIGAIMLVSVLALAGVGVSIAGFYDEIFVYGYVSTATVEMSIVAVSGTWVWKIWGWDVLPVDPVFPSCIATFIPDEEILIVRGYEKPTDAMIEAWLVNTGAQYEYAAYAEAIDYSYDDVKLIGMDFWQIFPCIDFCADVIIHYEGCIPAHLTIEDFYTTGDPEIFDYMTFRFYHMYWDDGWYYGDEILPIDWPVQVHYCDYIGIVVCIHLPQDNTLQNLWGYFEFWIHALQWNDLCEPEV
jgi:hypothetical protein